VSARTKATWAKASILLTALVLAALAAWPAAACPVCYGDAEDPVIDGTRWSVIFLGSLVYLMFGGAAGIVFAQRRKLRRLAEAPAPDPWHGLHLVSPDDDPSHSNHPTDPRS